SVERIRLCKSGTEANLFALGAARAHTGREAVMIFAGGYHGGALSFGSYHAGMATQPTPNPLNVPMPWVVAPYNDTAGALALLEENAGRLAAVLLEPLQGGAGCIPADRDFLQALREACTKHGIPLIFDE